MCTLTHLRAVLHDFTAATSHQMRILSNSNTITGINFTPQPHEAIVAGSLQVVVIRNNHHLFPTDDILGSRDVSPSYETQPQLESLILSLTGAVPSLRHWLNLRARSIRNCLLKISSTSTSKTGRKCTCN